MKKIFFLVPTLYSSPVEGALAIANELAKLDLSVEVIVLKKIGNLNKKYKFLKYIFLEKNNIISKIFFLRKYFLTQKNKKIDIRIFSFTFLPDFINFFLRDLGLTFTSVRGSLTSNYFYSYFPFGFIFSTVHYFIISKIHIIFSMTKFMQKEINYKCKRKSFIVGSFINKEYINQFKTKKNYKIKKHNILNLFFLGNLVLLKKPFSLISIANQLEKKKIKFKIYVVGKYSSIIKKIILFFIINKNSVKFCGYKKNPYTYFYKSDYLLHLSTSEGIPRSVIEALYLKLPVIIRDSYGTNEYINRSNGFLFNNIKNICPYLVKNYNYGQSKKKINIQRMPKLLKRREVINKLKKKLFINI